MKAAAAEPQIVMYQDGITPFWRKLPTFFKYPLHFGPLVCIGTLALFSVATAFVGGLFRGLLAYLFLRYAFSVMEQTARGDSNPESPDLSMWGGTDRRPMKQTVVFLFYFAIVFGLAMITAKPVPVPEPARQAPMAQVQSAPVTAENADDDDEQEQHAAAARAQADRFSEAAMAPAAVEPEVKLPFWFYLLAIACAIPLPAAIMVIAMEDNLLRALNPLMTFMFIRAMGMAYFVLWLFFAVILGVRQAIMTVTAEMSAFIRLPLETLVGSYLLLALFAMMGYAIYQYHQQLGYDVKVDFDSMRKKETAKAAPPADPLTAHVNDLVAEGKVDKALDVLYDAMRYDKLNPDLNDRKHELLVLKGDNAKTLEHGQTWLKALVAGNRSAKARLALKKLKGIDAAFEPNADVLLPLAHSAAAGGDYATAIDLVKGFDKRFPQHADIPGVYLLVAKITSEHLRQPDRAMKILTALLHHYPHAPVKGEAIRYLAALGSAARKAVPATAS